MFGFEHRNRAGALLRKNPKDLPQMFKTNTFAPTTRLLVAESNLMLAGGSRNCAKSSLQLASIPLAKQRLLAPGRSGSAGGSAALRLGQGGQGLAGFVHTRSVGHSLMAPAAQPKTAPIAASAGMAKKGLQVENPTSFFHCVQVPDDFQEHARLASTASAATCS